MQPRRILVTGAGGFVGAHLLPRLRARFPDAVLVTPGAGAPRVDVADAASVERLVQPDPPDACIHLAAVSGIPAATGNPDHAWRVNVHGTLVLARALRRARPDCVFVYVSSSEVYGRSFAPGIPLDEGAVPAPMNTYAATKAAADLALGAMAGDGLHAIRLRPFNHTGPGQSAGFVMPAFARQAARIAAGLQEPRMQVGSLDPRRDFLDVRDICDAYVACLAQADHIDPGTILNLASGTARRIGDILDRICALAGVAPEIAVGAKLLRKGDIPSASGNAAAARALLGWGPRIAWDQTLADVVADWRARVAAAPDCA